MQYGFFLNSLLGSFATLLFTSSQIVAISPSINPSINSSLPTDCKSRSKKTNFLIVAGGGNPSMNEIALEKNVLYFQRTLKTLGYNPANASIFFANGNDGQATVRYIDENNRQQFKVPDIPYLQEAATLENFHIWLEKTKNKKSKNPIFFYFTGHGIPAHLILWENQHLSVQQLAIQLDQLSQDTPVVVMMSQCYAGSFANFIYQGGRPSNPIALQTRCGFFATIATATSVGCTPEVNEADYKDYSSSFFAGLSGVNRIGQKVASADYDQDGRVSFREAHAFAKIDEKTTDLPISTSESWLQKQIPRTELKQLLEQPIIDFIDISRPEQKYVINSIVEMFGFDKYRSYRENTVKFFYPQQLGELQKKPITKIEKAYLSRLGMELSNIGVEKQIRSSGDKKAIAILDRLLKCEGGSWE
ncbi:MAG: Caspase domain-containing protein [Moorea sp. SIO2B7]|nr:Caspase domain-containing protein [Moorena sp. SIO2B7]